MSEKYDSLLSEYRRLAKRADQRLLRIERLAENENYKAIKQYAYKKAAKDITHWSGATDKPRFNTAPPKGKNAQASYMMLQAKVNDIKSFLEAPTSTKSGVTKVYNKRAEAYNKQFGTSYTWQGIKQVTDSALFEKLESKMDRYIVLKVLGVIDENREEVEKRLAGKKENGQTIHIEVDDEVVGYEVEKVLTYYKKDLRKLLKSGIDMNIVGK